MRAPDPERLASALVDHSYRMMPTSMIGTATGAFLFGVGAVGLEGGSALWLWWGLQFVALLVNVALLAAYHAGRFADSTRARRAHRFGVAVAGITWGIAGVLWPVRHELGPGLALTFCYAGMCAGGATTLAGDPKAYALFAATSLLPDVVQSFASAWWISALLLAFLGLTSETVMRNGRVLRRSLALGFENAELLERAVREREAAIEARADAERAARAKTRFLAAASHDLRQPVQALSLFVEVLQRDAGLAREETSRAIGALARTSDAMRAMLEGLLDVSRLDAGVVVTFPRPVDLDALLAEVVAALRDEAEAHDMVVSAAGTAPFVRADPALLARVLHNLAANAVRHARRGRVLLAVRRRGPEVVVQVWDQGPGIADEDRERIFEEFVQLENAERDRRRGLGLGLPIVRRICEQSGWCLTLRSTPGRGSVFSITLPVVDVPSDEVRPRTSDDRGIEVLLVEDDALVREATLAFLASSGCAVQVEPDAERAWGALARRGGEGGLPDVVLVDHRLPGACSGLELVRRIVDGGLDVASVLLTGDADVVPISEANTPGRLVLRKPVSGEALQVAIRRAVAERTALRRALQWPETSDASKPPRRA